MRFLFLIIVLIFNIESVNANFLNKKPEGLLVFKDSNNHKKSPLTLYFDLYNNNQLKRNNFKEFDSYAVGKLFIILKYCDKIWGGLPNSSFYSNQIKDISKSDYKSFLSGYSSVDITKGSTSGPIKQYLSSSFCAPRGTNKETFLKFMDEYFVALKLIINDKEKYLASINSISPDEPKQVNETKNCSEEINTQNIIISSAISRKETKYDYKGTWKKNLLLNHSNEKFGNYKEYKIQFLDSFSLGNLYRSSVKQCNIKSPRKEISLLSWADLRAFDSTYNNTYNIDANLREYESSNNFKFKNNDCSNENINKINDLTKYYLKDLERAVNSVLGLNCTSNTNELAENQKQDTGEIGSNISISSDNDTENTEIALVEGFNIKELQSESEFMIFNIKEFAKANINIDGIKLAQIFLKFNKSITFPWSKQTALNYIELKNFMKSIDGFEEFIVNQYNQKQKKSHEKINRISSELIEYNEILKTYIFENIGDAKSNEAIKLSEDIKFALEDLNIDILTSLQNQLKSWFSENNILY